MSRRNIPLSIIVLLLITCHFLSPVALSMVRSDIHPEVNRRATTSYEYSGAINIDGDAAFAFSAWPGSGSRLDPFIIEGLRFVGLNTAITIARTTSYFIIRNCSFEGVISSQNGVVFNSVRNGRIEDCTFNSFYFDAIRLYASSNCSIALNVIYGCTNGIQIRNSANCNITANTVFKNEYGIFLDSSVGCIVSSSDVFGNQQSGVSCISLSENNTMYSNRIGWNPAWDDTSSGYGNARDDSIDNLWDNNVSQGNSWHDWDLSDNYTIPGSAIAIDRFPSLLTDDNAPTISQPFDISLVENSEGYSIRWSVSDQFPHSIQIFQTDFPMITQQWNGTDVVFNLDHLTVGVWNVTIIAYDAAGNNVSDTVLVTVVYEWIGGLGTELVVWASVISVIFMVVVLMIYKVLR